MRQTYCHSDIFQTDQGLSLSLSLLQCSSDSRGCNPVRQTGLELFHGMLPGRIVNMNSQSEEGLMICCRVPIRKFELEICNIGYHRQGEAYAFQERYCLLL